jgi:hypothetical protein
MARSRRPQGVRLDLLSARTRLTALIGSALGIGAIDQRATAGTAPMRDRYETQKRTNDARQQASCFRRPKLACFMRYKIPNLLSGQRLQIRSASRTGSREEAMRDGGVNNTTRGSKAALAQQICRVLLDQPIHFRLLMTQKCLRRYNSSAVHPRQKMRQCDRIAASAALISQESLANAERDLRHGDALPVKPTTESDRKPSLAQETLVRVRVLVESRRIRLQDRAQRAFDRCERYLALPAAQVRLPNLLPETMPNSTRCKRL